MPFKLFRRLIRCRRGQATIELAAASTVLTMIMFGTIELSRAFYSSCEVENAARAGVQYAAVFPTTATTTEIQNAALADAANMQGLTVVATQYLQCDNGSTPNFSTGTCASGAVRTYVKVVTTGQFNTVGRYPFIPRPIVLNGSAILRVN